VTKQSLNQMMANIGQAITGNYLLGTVFDFVPLNLRVSFDLGNVDFDGSDFAVATPLLHNGLRGNAQKGL
jgi:hypothetical protein